MTDLADIPSNKIPVHIAIIMDGNGRWAVQRGLERVRGHQQGAKCVKTVVNACTALHRKHGRPEYLTLYSFSLENWKRPLSEISFLMEMYIDYLRRELPKMMEDNVRFRQIGRTDQLPDPVLDAMNTTLKETENNTGLNLVLALNYGSRGEITDAVRSIARKVADGSLKPAQINESTISQHLYTAGMPDPDLLIRTAGEMRVSNYLLWQISYAELVVLPVLWPDFGDADLHAAIAEFAQRNRRFGALDETNSPRG
jgi:undecaprenyl diphosphate synthase